MGVYAVFVSSRRGDASRVDAALQALFADVYRVGEEFWLVDTARESDEIYGLIRTELALDDKLFIGGLTRDVFPMLSTTALGWLTAPGRSWGGGRGRAGAAGPTALADLAAAAARAA